MKAIDSLLTIIVLLCGSSFFFSCSKETIGELEISGGGNVVKQEVQTTGTAQEPKATGGMISYILKPNVSLLNRYTYKSGFPDPVVATLRNIEGPKQMALTLTWYVRGNGTLHLLGSSSMWNGVCSGITSVDPENEYIFLINYGGQKYLLPQANLDIPYRVNLYGTAVNLEFFISRP